MRMRPVNISVGDKEKRKARAEGYPTVRLSSLREGDSRYDVGQPVLAAMKFPSSKAGGKENACKNPKQQMQGRGEPSSEVLGAKGGIDVGFGRAAVMGPAYVLSVVSNRKKISALV